MTRWLYFLIPILILCLQSILYSEESIVQINRKAEAYWNAQDYAEASTLYESLLSRKLPEWQRTRILYNLGTIRLAQHQPDDALDYFEQISVTELAIPRLGRDLFLNEGIAFLQQARELTNQHSPFALDQEALLINQSLLTLAKAESIDCQIQQSEQEKKISHGCTPSQLVHEWLNKAHHQLNTLRQQQRELWIEQTSIENLASLISDNIKEVIHLLQSFQEQKKAQSSGSYNLYFYQQAESLLPLWKALQNKKLSQDQKELIDSASTLYLKGAQDLTNDAFPSAVDQFNQTIKSLSSLAFPQESIQQIQLIYEILLLQDPITLGGIKKLQSQLEHIKVKKDLEPVLERIKKDIQTSQNELEAKHLLESRFYLIASGSLIDEVTVDKQNDPASILKHALDQANRALQLTYLQELIQEESHNPLPHSHDTLKTQQHEILNRADFFIPAVLKYQKKEYQHPDPKDSHCQESPWDQIVPLFDHGYLSAQLAEKRLSEAEFSPQAVLSSQKQTVQDWQRALNLLLQAPQQNKGGATPSAASHDLNETFRLIQEMYLQDQTQPEKGPSQEMHSW